MTTQIEITQRNHRRAVRFFWGFLLCTTTVSLIGNIAHAVLPYLSRIVIQIGAAAVPPIALLAAVHGIALAVRAGASGRVYRWAIAAVAVIGAGAFMLSFRALRDLLIQTGTPPAWAVTARRSTLLPKRRESTTGLRSGSWRARQSTGSDSSRRSAEWSAGRPRSLRLS
jgi:hypothetical protein